ncbi:MAG: serine/threonine-protein phosphatase, partial [Clostridia bacterium]|nr:serine/threonine-protein phosphatase [Clostridia bacterium]
YLAQYDNPRALLLRDGKNVDYPTRVRYVGDKEIHESRIPLQEGDILILMTDGVTNAGVGKVAPNGWPRAEVAALVESIYTPETSAQYLAASVASAARALALEQPDDDITVLAFRYRARRAVSMMIGPPENECDDDRVLRQFFAKESAHVVCGGTTATLVANYLGRELVTILETQTAELPAIGAIEGVDLVTEGVITLRKVVENAELLLQNGMNILPLYGKRDGASLLSHLLFEEATDLSIFFGTAVNPAHDALDIDFQSKLTLVKRLEELLTQMGKRVKVSLC